MIKTKNPHIRTLGGSSVRSGDDGAGLLGENSGHPQLHFLLSFAFFLLFSIRGCQSLPDRCLFGSVLLLRSDSLRGPSARRLIDQFGQLQTAHEFRFGDRLEFIFQRSSFFLFVKNTAVWTSVSDRH